MNEVMRFLLLRPPEPGNPVVVRPSKPFADELAQAHQAPDRRAALKEVAGKLVSSARGLKALTNLSQGTQLLAAQAELAEKAAAGEVAANDVGKAVKDAFGKPAAQVVKAPEWAADRDQLADNLLAAKLLSRDGEVEARSMEALLRLIALIERVATDDDTVKEPGAVRAALDRPTQIGPSIAAPVRDVPKQDPPKDPPGPDPELPKLRDRIKNLEALSTQLTRVAPKSLALPEEPAPATEEGPPDAVRVLRDDLAKKIRAGALERIETGQYSAVAGELRTVQSALPAPAPAIETVTRLTLTQAATESFSEAHRAALKSLKLELTQTPLPAAMTVINSELVELHTQLLYAETKPIKATVFGSHAYEMEPYIGGMKPDWLGTPAVPSSHGVIKPVGVGDLLVVRQQLKRYQGGEVGHIENILKGEFKKREHRRARTTEETITVEVETTREEERDTQTAERFELQREAASVVKDDTSFKAGLSVSGSYGPTVEFKASTDFAMNHSKEESSKTATKYSKEVTDRATSKISERHREQRILKTIEVFEEKNEHGVDNTNGNGHVVGVYQWVDKVYEAQVFNYGKRMMFDIMVPEPAAFWIYANSNKPKPGATLTKPVPFSLSPDQITEANYALYVQRYEVSGVKPPPEPYQTVSKTFEGAASHDAAGSSTKVAEVPITDGYQAVSGHAVASATVWTDWENEWLMTVAVGKDVWTRKPGTFVNHYYSLDNERGSVPLGVRTFGTSEWMVTIEVDCQRTVRAYKAWQLETHTAIQQAYLKLERDYQEELAALETQAGIEIQGRNPVENRLIERAELKKQAISVFTAQHYDLFGAITFSSQGYPQPLLSEAEAEGRYIRFFEQAFEWEHMMYLFYPYFWGRKSGWPAHSLLQDVDQQFAEFLKAGAARVVVPVRPGFEAALAHFLDTGEIWEGADPPTLTSPLYVSIIDEIKERDQAPGDEIAQGEPWDVRLPTTLVKLRDDNALPAWTKQPDGTWVEA
jgi:hypothetical protein